MNGLKFHLDGGEPVGESWDMASRDTWSRSLAGLLALVTWGGLALQLYILIQNTLAQGRPLIQAFASFFWFFTILSNIIAAVVASAVALGAPDALRRPPIQSAAALYMAVVGLTYELLLRGLLTLHGLPLVADILLHDVATASFVLYWLFFTPKGSLRWTMPLAWLVYPLGYFAYALLRGEATGRYPYPFINVATLGWPRTLVNAAMLTAGFLILGLLLVGVDRALAARATEKHGRLNCVFENNSRPINMRRISLVPAPIS